METEPDEKGKAGTLSPLQFLENMTALYNIPQKDKKTRCIILPNCRWKFIWDFYIVILLLAISIVVPFRLAFSPDEDTDWIIAYSVIDSQFLIDMILTFFTATVNHDTQKVCTEKKIIASSYLRSWFFVDLISILPLDVINMVGMNAMNANSLIRFAKIGKLYKLIRLSRLAKLFKLLKGNNAVFSQMSNSMQLSSGVERIVFIAIFGIFFFHISSCMWVFMAEFEGV